jgi:septal ring factor EnvC (AmiA/AmiB activator)
MVEEIESVKTLLEKITENIASEYEDVKQKLESTQPNFFTFHQFVEDVNKEIISFGKVIQDLLIDIDKTYPNLKTTIKLLKKQFPNDAIVKDLLAYDDLLYKIVRALAYAGMNIEFHELVLAKALKLISKAKEIDTGKNVENKINEIESKIIKLFEEFEEMKSKMNEIKKDKIKEERKKEKEIESKNQENETEEGEATKENQQSDEEEFANV